MHVVSLGTVCAASQSASLLHPPSLARLMRPTKQATCERIKTESIHLFKSLVNLSLKKGDINDAEGMQFYNSGIHHLYLGNPSMIGQDPTRVIREELGRALSPRSLAACVCSGDSL
jgi:hypothetical protein